MSVIKIIFKIFFVLSVFSLCLCLSIWQWQRAKTKRTMIYNYQQRIMASPRTINTLTPPYNRYEYYRLKLTGKFDNRQQFLLENRFYQHRTGVEVFTPFHIFPSNKVIMINRGWLAIPAVRNMQLKIPNIQGQQTIVGIIRIPSTKQFTLSNQLESVHFPIRITKIDLKQMSEQLHQDVFPFYLQLEQPTQFALQPNWRINIMPPEKHIAYAWQWGMLAGVWLLLVGIYLYTQRREKYGYKTANKK